MKCNPWRWLWGLIPILMLGWIAVLAERGRIEEDLSKRAQLVLKRSGYDWAKVRFDGRDAVVSGSALDESEPAKALSAMLDTYGVRKAENQSSLVAKVDKFEWSAIRRDGRIRIDGVVPSEKARSDVLGMMKASFPGVEVDDRTNLARGAPPLDVWLGGVGFGIKQLASLQQGRVDLENTNLSVSGDAIDATNYRRIRQALTGRLPRGIRLRNESVRPPVARPYVWSARRQGKEVLLAGHVPNDTVRDELMRAARSVVADAKVVDRMEPAAGAPDNFAAAAGNLVQQLGALDDGRAEIRDRSARLTGTTDTAVRATNIMAGLEKGALAAYRVAGEIGHREPVIKTITPYVTEVRVDSGTVVLSGYVPDEKARGSLLALAGRQLAGRTIKDQLLIGAGQPPDWAQCMEAGIDAVRRLGNGNASLTGRRLAISGTTDLEQLAQSLPGEVRAVVGSSCDANVRVALDVAAIQEREATRRRIEEEVQRRKAEAERKAAETAAERRRAEAAAKSKADEALRRANQTAGLKAEEERRRAEQAARLKAEAERQRAEQAARLKAEAERQRAEQAARLKADEERRRAEQAARLKADEERRSAEQAARLKADEERRRAEQAAALAARAQAERQARQQQAAACQSAMARVVREGVINFERARFTLAPSSYPTLNRVAVAANRCPNLVVEIGGHTDSEGTPERNQRLSDRRASAVRDYLVKAGVDPARLTAIGYGQYRNIAPNDTPENRAKNRRIEFVVKMEQ